jgi:hypothetical protein
VNVTAAITPAPVGVLGITPRFFGIRLRQSAFCCDFPGRYPIFMSYSWILIAHRCNRPAGSAYSSTIPKDDDQ